MKFKDSIGATGMEGQQLRVPVCNMQTTAIPAYALVVIDTANISWNGPYTTAPNSPLPPVKETTSGADALAFGIAGEGGIAAGKIGEIIQSGPTKILKKAETWAVGDVIVSDTSAGCGAKDATPAVGTVVGKAIVAQTLTTDTYGYIWAMLV